MSRVRRAALLAGFFVAAGAGAAIGVGEGAVAGAGAGAIVLVFVLVAEFGRGDRARVLAGREDRADEREIAITKEATAIAYCVVIAVALPGFLVGIAHGHFNQFGVVCAVGGGVQIASALWLTTRR